MLTLGPSLVPWVAPCHLGPGLSSSPSFSSSGGPGGLVPGGRTAAAAACGMVQVPAYHGGADRRPSNKRVPPKREPSFGLVCLLDVVVVVVWWDDVMLAILRRESSIHARTLFEMCVFVDLRSGAIQRCLRYAPPRECVPSEMSFFQERKHRSHSFVACRSFFFICNNVSRPLNLFLCFSK